MTITGRLHIVPPTPRFTAPDPALAVSLALADPAVAKALRLFSGDSDWPNLYRIYEVVQDAAKPGIVESRWATKAQINRFTMSANNPSITGDASRHGKTNTAVSSAQGMSRVEATDLIRSVLRAWLNSRS